VTGARNYRIAALAARFARQRGNVQIQIGASVTRRPVAQQVRVPRMAQPHVLVEDA
jgi:hypothetical protein